jgi:hypothetical protein
MRLDILHVSVETCFRDEGFFGLSFFGDNDLSEEEVARRAKIRNGKIRTSTVGKIEAAGFSLNRRGDFPHLSMRFEERPSDDVLRRLVEQFDGPKPNPHPKR